MFYLLQVSSCAPAAKAPSLWTSSTRRDDTREAVSGFILIVKAVNWRTKQHSACSQERAVKKSRCLSRWQVSMPPCCCQSALCKSVSQGSVVTSSAISVMGSAHRSDAFVPCAGLPLHLQAEQQSGPSTPNTLLQQLQASRLPQPPMMGPMPGLLNPQQLQALMVFRQNPALFSNPVLQSQLAMLMWTQMQQQQAPMWPIHQPPPMLQPLTGQQPLSAAAQSASTHQPSCQGPAPLHSGSGRLSDECNSSGGSNDSGCIQTISGATPKVEQSPPADAQLAAQRFADDSDSAVTWAGRGADQTACTQSRSASHPEASGIALAEPCLRPYALYSYVCSASTLFAHIACLVLNAPCISMRSAVQHLHFWHVLRCAAWLCLASVCTALSR